MNPLIEVLRARAERRPGAPAISFPDADGAPSWTWADAWSAALRAGAGLRAAGVAPGDHVLLLVPELPHGVACLFGAWAAGAVPIQVGLPYRLEDVAGFLDELRALARRLDARHIVVSDALERLGGRTRTGLSADRVVSGAGGDTGGLPAAAPGPALIQLTSGSLERPRGAVLPADRLVAHLECIAQALPPGPDAVGVSWLPLYHDMGLIGGLLYPLRSGFPLHLSSPLDFRRRPYRWLQRMSQVRATHTAAPPSAFALARRLAGRARRDGLSLAPLRCAMVGAEPIPPAVLRGFAAELAPTGFRAEAFFPVYGLAEAGVAVTFPEPLAPTRFDAVDRVALERDGRAEPAAGPDALELTGVGAPIPRTELRIAGPDGAELPERRVGDILVRSDTGMTGYHGEPGATREAYCGGWLRTGDLGYLAGGQLFVTGRRKELIIRAGHNLLPSAIEEAAATIDGIREGGVAAVGVRSAARATERCVLVAEVRGSEEPGGALAERVLRELKRKGMEVDEVRLVPPRTLPRTTSGKLQRAALARALRSSPT